MAFTIFRRCWRLASSAWSLNNLQGRKSQMAAANKEGPLQTFWVTQGCWVALGYLLMLTNTAVFFIFWKKSLLQSPLVAGVKEQATTMKSDSAASWSMGTGYGQGSVRGRVQVRESKMVSSHSP